MPNLSNNNQYSNHKDTALKLLRERANEAAELYQAGKLDLHTAVDRIQDFAAGRGLIDMLGQDCVQAIITAAFRGRART